MKVRPSPNVASQNWPDASTISTSTKPTNAAFSCSGAADDLITANAATTITSSAMKMIRL